jgi:hypothetical protein
MKVGYVDFDSLTLIFYVEPSLKYKYRGANKSLAQPGRKQITATEDFDVHISYL